MVIAATGTDLLAVEYPTMTNTGGCWFCCMKSDIIFTLWYACGICSYLACIIDDYHTLFVQLLPSTSLLPKHHFLTHYPRCMLLCGPPSEYWCTRYEGQHRILYTATCAIICFRNICKTLAKRAKFSLATTLLQKRLFSENNDLGHSYCSFECDEN